MSEGNTWAGLNIMTMPEGGYLVASMGCGGETNTLQAAFSDLEDAVAWVAAHILVRDSTDRPHPHKGT